MSDVNWKEVAEQTTKESMASEIKTQYNVRIAPDINISIAFTHIVSSREDAHDVGEQDNAMMSAYLEGFGKATR